MKTGPGYVYVLGFDNGTVKVGRTQNPAQRLGAHQSGARKLGLTVADEWVSPLHAEWLANEDRLKAIAADLGGTALSAEYFCGVAFAPIVEKASELAFTAVEETAKPEAAQESGKPGPLSSEATEFAARVREFRLAKLRECVEYTEAEALRWRRKYTVEQSVCEFLDMGFTPAKFREVAMGYPAESRPPLLEVADVMAERVRWEAGLDGALKQARLMRESA